MNKLILFLAKTAVFIMKRPSFLSSKLPRYNDGMDTTPLYIIKATAPVRICDNGGWTDTWFAQYGLICNIAVSPHVAVEIAIFPRDDANYPQIKIHAANFDDTYSFNLPLTQWQRHPLIEACIVKMGVPVKTAVFITIRSDMPPGAATGTSAAVAVALLGALSQLNNSHLTNHQLAYLAHSVEVDMLGQQSGIQDQLAAAYGGINVIEMHDYPAAKVTPLTLPHAFCQTLERQLLLIYLGKPHHSSSLHEMVIGDLEEAGARNSKIEVLRQQAVAARNALYKQDLSAYGEALIANTLAQEALHEDLLGAAARTIIGIAQTQGVTGWKVNGAGGAGGSVTLLCKTAVQPAVLAAIKKALPQSRHIPIRLNQTGLRVWTE